MYDTKKAEEKMDLITKEIHEHDGKGMNWMLSPEPCGCNGETMSAKIRFRAYDWARNERREIHGGVISAMFDTSMGMTVLTYCDSEGVSTTDLNVSFIRPFKGESFIFETSITHLGRFLVRIRALAYDEETGKTLASATANFIHVK